MDFDGASQSLFHRVREPDSTYNHTAPSLDITHFLLCVKKCRVVTEMNTPLPPKNHPSSPKLEGGTYVHDMQNIAHAVVTLSRVILVRPNSAGRRDSSLDDPPRHIPYIEPPT